LRRRKDFDPASGQPFIAEGLVVFLSHELVDMDEIEEAIRTIWEREIGRKKRVVNSCQALLPIENDVFRLSTALVAVNRFAGQGGKVFRLVLPQQQIPI
jgi:hypothetical protein